MARRCQRRLSPLAEGDGIDGGRAGAAGAGKALVATAAIFSSMGSTCLPAGPQYSDSMCRRVSGWACSSGTAPQSAPQKSGWTPAAWVAACRHSSRSSRLRSLWRFITGLPPARSGGGPTRWCPCRGLRAVDTSVDVPGAVWRDCDSCRGVSDRSAQGYGVNEDPWQLLQTDLASLKQQRSAQGVTG
jgi:hypothetical protein